MRRLAWTLAAVLAQACSSTPDARMPVGTPEVTATRGSQERSTSQRGGRAEVVRVVDGDTFITEMDGEDLRVRLIGVDAPESVTPDAPVECFGAESSRFTARSLEGRRVRLEFDVERIDPFGRTLAYVWSGGRLFNRTLVARGFALAVAYPPNLRHQDRLERAERIARAGGRGLWGRCR